MAVHENEVKSALLTTTRTDNAHHLHKTHRPTNIQSDLFVAASGLYADINGRRLALAHDWRHSPEFHLVMQLHSGEKSAKRNTNA